MAARPGFTAVAVISLAIGIGANTAIFSLWNTVSRASLPGVQDPDSLVVLTNPSANGLWQGRWSTTSDGPRSWITYEEFEALRTNASGFSALMASQSGLNAREVRVNGASAEDVSVRLVSGEFFDVLGARGAAGRLFTIADEREPHVAVISHAYRRRRLGGRADAIGRTAAASGYRDAPG